MSKGTILVYETSGKKRMIHFRYLSVNGVIGYYRTSYQREPEYFSHNYFDCLLACDKITIYEVSYEDGGRNIIANGSKEFTPNEFFAKLGLSESDTKKMKSEQWYQYYLNSNDYRLLTGKTTISNL